MLAFDFLQSTDCVVHAEILVILGEDLDERPFDVGKDGEVLDEVQQPGFVARSSNYRFE